MKKQPFVQKAPLRGARENVMKSITMDEKSTSDVLTRMILA